MDAAPPARCRGAKRQTRSEDRRREAGSRSVYPEPWVPAERICTLQLTQRMGSRRGTDRYRRRTNTGGVVQVGPRMMSKVAGVDTGACRPVVKYVEPTSSASFRGAVAKLLGRRAATQPGKRFRWEAQNTQLSRCWKTSHVPRLAERFNNHPILHPHTPNHRSSRSLYHHSGHTSVFPGTPTRSNIFHY